MPQPDIRAQIIAGPLADVSIAYKNQSYVGDMVFPIKDNVAYQAKITKYFKGDWFRDEAKLRAPGTEAARGNYGLTTESISTDQYAFGKEVAAEDIAGQGMVGAPTVNMIQDAIEYATDKIDLKKEIRVADLMKSTTWADGVSGGEDADGKWASTEAAATNTFFADIKAGKIAIQKNTGFNANHILFDFNTMEDLKENPLVAEKIKYTQKNIVTADLIGSLLSLKVLIGEAIKNTANQKLTDVMTARYIWDTNDGKGDAFLFYRPATLGLKTPSAGGQFRVKQSNGSGRLIRNYYEANKDQWVYEVREDTDILAMASDLGYHWKDTIST